MDKCGNALEILEKLAGNSWWKIVDRAIQDMIRSNEFTITPDNIIKEVCRYFRLEEDQIRGER